MNVGELKSALANFPDDLEILTAADDEGNGYRPLYYTPSVYYINKGESKHGYVESIISEDELTDDEYSDDWDLTFRGNVEPRLIIG